MKCPNCNNDVKDGTRFCPKCGFGIQERVVANKTKKIMYFIVVVFVCLGIGVAGYGAFKTYEKKWNKEHSSGSYLRGIVEKIYIQCINTDGTVSYDLLEHFEGLYLSDELIKAIEKVPYKNEIDREIIGKVNKWTGLIDYSDRGYVGRVVGWNIKNIMESDLGVLVEVHVQYSKYGKIIGDKTNEIFILFKNDFWKNSTKVTFIDVTLRNKRCSSIGYFESDVTVYKNQ
jgi:hypothetical protein